MEARTFVVFNEGLVFQRCRFYCQTLNLNWIFVNYKTNMNFDRISEMLIVMLCYDSDVYCST